MDPNEPQTENDFDETWKIGDETWRMARSETETTEGSDVASPHGRHADDRQLP